MEDGMTDGIYRTSVGSTVRIYDCGMKYEVTMRQSCCHLCTVDPCPDGLLEWTCPEHGAASATLFPVELADSDDRFGGREAGYLAKQKLEASK
jgi:hypothetical protein